MLRKDNERFTAAVEDLDALGIPGDGEVLLTVEYSTVNYKDGLAITDKSPVVRKWPMVPGIDCAGVVEQSAHLDFKRGDRVVLNGWGVGEVHWGGLAQKARLKGEWLIALPAGMTTRQSMQIGTAGYTAMLCVRSLEKHGVAPANGEILVTGASGGVGSVAVSLLSRLGYRVIASTGKLSEAEYLRYLGAAEVIDRAALGAPGKPLQKERFAGVIDSVGSATLVNACAQTRYGGAVAACGLAQGPDFAGTVLPFILRGITLYGVDSVMAPKAIRLEAWQRLARDMDSSKLNAATREVGLRGALQAAQEIVAGKTRGRVLVDVNR